MIVPALLIAAGVFLVAAFAIRWWGYDHEGLAAALLVVGLALGVGAFVLAIKHEEDSCRKAGGSIQGTGEFYPVTQMINTGKVLVPVTTMHEHTECVIP